MAGTLKGNLVWNSSYQILTVLAPLITVPYVSRVLGPEQVGMYSYTYAIAYYFVLFATLGMAQYGVRLIAETRNDRVARSKCFWSAWAAQLCVSIPVAAVYLIYSLISPVGGRTVALLWGLWVMAAVLDISWLFFGMEEFKLPTIRNFITKAAGIVLILTLCKTENDLWAYILGTSLAFFANSILLMPYIHKYVDFIAPSWDEIRRHFAPNLHLFAPVIAVSLYMQFNKLLLGQFSGLEQVGYFEYSDKIVRLPLTLITALCSVMLPHMTRKLAAGDRKGALRLLGESYWFILALAVGITFGIASISPELVPVYLGTGYDPCKLAIPTEVFALPFISGSNILGMQYLLPSHADKQYSRSVWTGAVVNIICCVAFLGSYGALGAAVATVVAEASVFFYQCWSVRRELPIRIYIGESLPFYVIGVITFAAIRLFVHYAEIAFGVGWVLLLLEILFAILVYGLMAFAWCYKRDKISVLKSFLLK